MDFKQLLAYKKAFELSMIIFEISKLFPKEEKYSLTDQKRRNSSSVCSNISKAFYKIINKFDSDGENSETNTWLNFALACENVSKEKNYIFTIQNK